MLARCLVVFTLAVAGPAAAQLQPAGPTAPAVANWVNVGTNGVGTTIWFDANTIVIDGYYKSAGFRFDRADGTSFSTLLEFDCDGGLYREMKVEPVSGVPTRVPATQWDEFSEDRAGGVASGSAMRERLCNWGR